MWENLMDNAVELGEPGGLLSGWRAGVVAVLAGGPALVVAAITQDTAVVFSGLATGIFFAIWGIWASGTARILRTSGERLRAADVDIDDLRRANRILAEENARQRIQLAEFEEASSDELKVFRDRTKGVDREPA